MQKLVNANSVFFCLFVSLIDSVCFSGPVIRVGLLGEFKRPTGSFSQPFGNEIKDGTALALTWLKKTDKEANIAFEQIDIDNSISNIDGHIRKASKSGIHYFIGLGTTDQSIAARQALADTNSVLVTPTASSTDLLKAPARTILLFPTNNIIASAMAKEVKGVGFKKILTIYATNNKYSVDIKSSFKRAFEEAGGLVEEIGIRAGHADLGDVIKKIKGGKFESVFVPLFELDAAKVIAEITRSNLHPFYVGTDAWGTYSNVIRVLIKGPQKKAMIPVVYDPDFEGETNRWFSIAFRKQFNRPPTDLAAFSFDAVSVVYKLTKVCSNIIETSRLSTCLSLVLPIETTTGLVKQANGNALIREVRARSITLGQVQ